MPTPRQLTDAERTVLARELLRTPGGRLGWVLTFLREDPQTWLPEHAILHGYRLHMLAHWTHVMSERHLDPPRGVSVDVAGGQYGVPWTPARVRRFHRRLRPWMRTLVSGVTPGNPVQVGMPVPLRGLTLSVSRLSSPREKPAQFFRFYRGPEETVLLHRVAEWICATDRLVACRQCGEPCLALRKRLFCSPACLQLHHDRKKIENRKRKTKGDPR